MYPEYAEEVKTSNESPNNNKMARTISLQKTFETQTYPSRSQVNCSERKGFHLKFGSKSSGITGMSGILGKFGNFTEFKLDINYFEFG